MPDSRKLGSLEETMEILNKRAKTWNLVTISRIKGNLQEAFLRQSLDILQYRHPRLNSRIIDFENCLYFKTAGTQKIDLRVLNPLNEEQWQEVVNEEMNQVIDSSKCLMRVVLAPILGEKKISYLITTLHHAIADGLSSIQLHSQILNYYQRLASGDTIQPIIKLEPLPPIESIITKYTQDYRGCIYSNLLSLKLGIQKLLYQPKTLGFEKYVSIPQRTSQIIHKQIEPDLTRKFVNKCRQENVTVYSALCAILMFTVARKIIKPNQKSVNVNCLSYLDLRRLLQPPISEADLGVLATSMMQFYTIKQHTYFWELARTVKSNLETSIKRGDIFYMPLIAKQLINFCFFFPKQVAATVSVSNVGKINIPNIYGELELEEISFAGSHALYAGMFVIHAASFQEKMLLNFGFSQPSISRKSIDYLIENVMSCIYDICNSNNGSTFFLAN
ncbi:alcohol acetyltransferase [Anabaena cylindrica FACHB-243]|uniref:Phthiocerol/phthiodiolone dimycocerosyl transferase n=1 Tax=Anabaena cylindrica (strain ATCC 27899 / PCC 7122) TaxID=272123 RepID=K9ZIT4_ANACC|nr:MULTISPECIES: condensation domain-containing protein [Anabaena]AFZ58472.1 Alcohol acetyltransferase [Anabaena cylindrica PCC 7122]MBD2417306.1 alcohol acetyltransferase [Anabaena cylindrica FACHB-243]MBY5281427.1 alcohol acetyltransferase [Anabaena sp. CCAP 1446/1C]MBY5310182.1 alcohol acetyltransferase [Anabaena sp. CCAP 1446/1C]MCM2410131.1 condensation domain-containing protein [Anabaena sp. CCAP 1446/1C]